MDASHRNRLFSAVDEFYAYLWHDSHHGSAIVSINNDGFLRYKDVVDGHTTRHRRRRNVKSTHVWNKEYGFWQRDSTNHGNLAVLTTGQILPSLYQQCWRNLQPFSASQTYCGGGAMGQGKLSKYMRCVIGVSIQAKHTHQAVAIWNRHRLDMLPASWAQGRMWEQFKHRCERRGHEPRGEDEDSPEADETEFMDDDDEDDGERDENEHMEDVVEEASRSELLEDDQRESERPSMFEQPLTPEEAEYQTSPQTTWSEGMTDFGIKNETNDPALGRSPSIDFGPPVDLDTFTMPRGNQESWLRPSHQTHFTSSIQTGQEQTSSGVSPVERNFDPDLLSEHSNNAPEGIPAITDEDQDMADDFEPLSDEAVALLIDNSVEFNSVFDMPSDLASPQRRPHRQQLPQSFKAQVDMTNNPHARPPGYITPEAPPISSSAWPTEPRLDLESPVSAEPGRLDWS